MVRKRIDTGNYGMTWKVGAGSAIAISVCAVLPMVIAAGGLGVLGRAGGNGVALAIGALLLAAIAAAYWTHHRRATTDPACAMDGSCGCKQQEESR